MSNQLKGNTINGHHIFVASPIVKCIQTDLLILSSVGARNYTNITFTSEVSFQNYISDINLAIYHRDITRRIEI